MRASACSADRLRCHWARQLLSAQARIVRGLEQLTAVAPADSASKARRPAFPGPPILPAAKVESNGRARYLRDCLIRASEERRWHGGSGRPGCTDAPIASTSFLGRLLVAHARKRAPTDHGAANVRRRRLRHAIGRRHPCVDLAARRVARTSIRPRTSIGRCPRANTDRRARRIPPDVARGVHQLRQGQIAGYRSV
jgi:hypothetical protein